MSFDVRCPECQARLRLDEEPDPGTEIECPRCDASFKPPKPKGASKPEDQPKEKDKKPKANKEGGKKAAGPKKRKVKKTRTNPVVLLIGIAFGFLFLFGVGAAMVWVMNRPGKVLDMLSFVSSECNHVRGINLTHWNKYPGYVNEVNKIYNANVKAAADECAKASGKDTEGFLDYVVVAKIREASTTTMYVLRTSKSINVETTGNNLPNSRPNGASTWAMGPNAAGVLAGATVYIPNNRTIVIVGRGAHSGQMLSAAQTGKASSFTQHFNDTAKTTARGGSWLLVRNTGALKNYIAAQGESVKDLPGMDRAKTAPMMGVWVTPGGSGVRVGLALECSSSKEAGDFVKAMKAGPLGKGDESEPTNNMKQAGISGVSDKKAFSEYMQFATFTSSGACAYVYSNVSGEQNVRVWMQTFNNPAAASDEGGGGGGLGFGPPGGGGPAMPGMPGGVVTPGMGP